MSIRPLDRQEAIEDMKRLIPPDDQEGQGDVEMMHVYADEITVGRLLKLGENDLVALYHKVPKWFA